MKPPRDRFMAKVRADTSGCWLWTGAGHPTGYGRFAMATKQTDFAHRASWRIFKGEIPKGILVCHHCDVRLCVNPEHLFLGTARDNMRDAATKGRIVTPAANYASDETHQVAILTNAQVREIRASGDASRDLAVRFGVSYWAIWLARTGRTFRGVR